VRRSARRIATAGSHSQGCGGSGPSTSNIVTAEPTLMSVIRAARAIQIAVSGPMVIFRSPSLSATVRTGPSGRGVCVLDSGDQLRVVRPGFCIRSVRPRSEQDDLSCDEVAALTALALNAHLRPCFQIRSGAFRDRVHARLQVEAYHEA
jgi:hypothetical protein